MGRTKAFRSSSGICAMWIIALQLSLAGQAAAWPLISEVLYDAEGSDNGLSFVELYGDPGESLVGVVIEGINGSNGAVVTLIELSGEIFDDGLFVIADTDADGLTQVSNADLLANFDFQNGPDSIVLRRGDEVLDALGYGDFDPGEIFAGEGLSAPDGVAGESLARVFANLDSDDNRLDFELLSTPTPGEASVSAVPEPRAGALVLASLAAIATRARRISVA
jgi:hypothetical protein